MIRSEPWTNHTPNTVIAWNVRRLRRHRSWIQAELAGRLTERDYNQSTFSLVSAAETAGRSDRDRQFTVNEVSVLARVCDASRHDLGARLSCTWARLRR